MNNNLSLKEGRQIKIILLFALINSSFFIAIGGSGIFRLFLIILMNISGILLVKTFLRNLSSFNILRVSIYFKFLFLLLILWSIFTVLRSFNLESSSLITLFGHYLMAWAWLTPVAIVLGLNIFNWLKLFNYFSKILLIASILGFFAFFYPTSYNIGLLESFCFLPLLLLTYNFQHKKTKRIVFLSILIFLLITVVVSLRGHLLFIILIFIFSFFQYLNYKSEFKYSKKMLSVLILFLLIMILWLQFDKINNSISGNKELTTDTRTFLFEELFMDMSQVELIVGRGALGTYYSPYFSEMQRLGLPGDNETRSVNEVGYLEMILKGGYIMMALYILILFPAALLGIFRSNNLISKMCGYYILCYLIIFSVSFYPVFSAEYILLWMATGTVISKENRRYNNNQITYEMRKKFNRIKL